MKATQKIEDSPLAKKTRQLVAKKHLTIPLISMAHTPLLTCQIKDEPHVDERITAMGTDTKTAPTVILVLDLDDGAEKLLVVNTIIASAFERAGGRLAGRYFQFRAGNIREGKRYRDIDVTEMEMAGDDPEAGHDYKPVAINTKEVING